MVRKNWLSVFVVIAAIVTIAGTDTTKAQSTPRGDLRVVVELLGNETLDPTRGPATVTNCTCR